MTLRRKLSLGLVGLLLLAACSSYVTDTIPPVIDLRNYSTVAVIDFPVRGLFPSQTDVTHRFLASVHSAQPGVKILELGSEQQVLASLGRSSLDIDAIRMIGQKYGVDAVLSGEMNVTAMQPSVSLSRALTKLDASAKVKGELSAKVRETATGATAWTNGAHGTWTLGGFSMSEQGLISGGISDVDAKYEDMVSDLVSVATRDFRPTYQRRRVN